MPQKYDEEVHKRIHDLSTYYYVPEGCLATTEVVKYYTPCPAEINSVNAIVREAFLKNPDLAERIRQIREEIHKKKEEVSCTTQDKPK